MRVLVTGGAGFIGSNLALRLCEEGHAVTALDDFSVGHFENLRDFPGDVVAADLSVPSAWQERVGKVDAVFHEAAITDTTVTDQLKMMRVNVEAFRGLLEWAVGCGVKKVIYASSAGVYGDSPVPMRETAPPLPLNVYAFSKRVMESVARDFSKRHPKVAVVGLRYFNVFGPREKFKGKAASMFYQLAVQMLSGANPRVFEFGEQYRDFIYVRDVVEANILAAAKAPSGVYNVCTGRKTTFNEMIEALNAVLRTKLAPEYFKNPYPFYQNETLGDPAAAAGAFGFSAGTSIRKAVEDYFGAGGQAPARS